MAYDLLYTILAIEGYCKRIVKFLNVLKFLIDKFGFKRGKLRARGHFRDYVLMHAYKTRVVEYTELTWKFLDIKKI